MKDIINKKTLAFLFIAIFILLNILFITYINSMQENQLLSNSMILDLDSKYALVKNVKVPSDIKVTQSIMVSLDFFINNFDRKYTYTKESNNVKIVYNNKDLSWKPNSNILVTVTQGNSKKQIEYTDITAESIGPTVYFPLHVLTEFFGVYYYNEGSLIIIEDTEKIQEIKDYISKNKNLVDKLKKSLAN